MGTRAGGRRILGPIGILGGLGILGPLRILNAVGTLAGLGILAGLGGAPAWAEGPRVAGSFLTGRAEPGAGDVRRLNGGRLAVDHVLFERWRLSAAAAWYSEARDGASAAGVDPDPEAAHHGGLLAGFHHRWIDAAAGLGWHTRTPAFAGRAHTDLLPAGHLRVGPEEIIFAEAALLDLSERAPGLGVVRVGLGSTLGGRARVFAGVGRSHHDDDLALVAVRVPVAQGLTLGIDAALGLGSVADFLVLGGAVGFTFDAPEPEPEPEAIEPDPQQRRAPGLSDPFGPGSPPAPLGPVSPTTPGGTPGTGDPLGPRRGFDGDPVQPRR